MKKVYRDLLESILIGIFIGAVVILGILQYQSNILVNTKIESIEKSFQDSKQINNYTILGLMRMIETLKTQLKSVHQTERLRKVFLEQKLRQVNVMVRNNTRQTLGSGVTLKYKNKYYVLTAGHLLDNVTEDLYLYENNNKICQLEIVKRDYGFDEAITTDKNDLLLLKPKNNNIKPKFYVELADNEVIEGTEIYIVGNPAGIEDVVSNGRVIFYEKNFMYYIDHSYFGNSGGGVYDYEGRLLGIVSHMSNLKPNVNYPDYIIAGAVRLNVIKDFLEGVN